jgi:hypothetical protein
MVEDSDDDDEAHHANDAKNQAQNNDKVISLFPTLILTLSSSNFNLLRNLVDFRHFLISMQF